jgi:hypothetical protein
VAKLLPPDSIERELNIIQHKGKKGVRLAVRAPLRTDEVIIHWETNNLTIRLSARAAKDYAHVLTHIGPNQPMKFKTQGYSGDTLTIEKFVERKDGAIVHFLTIQSALNKDSRFAPIRLTVEQAEKHAEQVLEIVAFLADQENNPALELAP